MCFPHRIGGSPLKILEPATTMEKWPSSIGKSVRLEWNKLLKSEKHMWNMHQIVPCHLCQIGSWCHLMPLHPEEWVAANRSCSGENTDHAVQMLIIHEYFFKVVSHVYFSKKWPNFVEHQGQFNSLAWRDTLPFNRMFLDVSGHRSCRPHHTSNFATRVSTILPDTWNLTS